MTWITLLFIRFIILSSAFLMVAGWQFKVSDPDWNLLGWRCWLEPDDFVPLKSGAFLFSLFNIKRNKRSCLEDVEEIIRDVMDYRNNPERIQEHIDENKFSKKAYYGKSGGKKYKLIIDSGSIVSVYPDGWNVVED